MFRKFPAHTLIATLLLAGACGAQAAVPADSTASASSSVRVSYRDLDLTSTAGSDALYARISQAAHKVCAVSDIRDLKAIAQSDSCTRDAITSALARVQAHQLAALSFPGARRG
jgi:UrcA family protein